MQQGFLCFNISMYDISVGLFHKDCATQFFAKHDMFSITKEGFELNKDRQLSQLSDFFPFRHPKRYEKPSVAFKKLLEQSQYIDYKTINTCFLPFIEWVVMQPEYNLWDNDDKKACDDCFLIFNALILEGQF